MTFDDVVDARCAKIKEVLKQKEREYASNESRFHTFIVAARVANITPEKALYGMMMKHIVSVMDIIENPDKFPSVYIYEKIGDLINYLILLEGMHVEYTV